MKIVLILTLFFVVTLPAFAQLTEQTVRQIIREELGPVKLDIAEMKGKIEALEGKMATKDDLLNMRKDFSEELKSVKSDVKEMNKELNSVKSDVKEMKGMMATKAEINTLMRDIFLALFIIWITIIAAIITIPYLYGRADREKVKKLETDVRELERLK